MGGIGAYRSLTHIAFYIIIFISSISFQIGYRTDFPKRLAKLLSMYGCLAYLIMANDLRIKSYYTKEYVKSEEARTEYLRDLKRKGFEGIAYPPSLKDSPDNIFVVNDFTSKSKEYAKKCFCEVESISFEIESP